MIEISSGDYDLLQSGTVIPFELKPIEFKIEGKSEVIKLQIEIKLVDSRPEKSFKAEMIEKNVLRLTLINMKKGLLSGTTAPLKLGELDDKPLLIHIRVLNFGARDPIIHYSFYLGREVSNNE